MAQITDPCLTVLGCDPSTKLCVFVALDGDHDGHVPISCGGDDCDDNNGNNFPGNKETCDGKDNNCDGVVDDGTNLCDVSTECLLGSCTCKPDHVCGKDCVKDFATDSLHCGVCNKACGANQQCIVGACTCATGSTMCGTNCVGLQYDPQNCGACGKVCASGCMNGTCYEDLPCGGTRYCHWPLEVCLERNWNSDPMFPGYLSITCVTNPCWMSSNPTCDTCTLCLQQCQGTDGKTVQCPNDR